MSHGRPKERARKWSADRTIQFLEYYEQFECLWNRKSEDYKNRDKKEEALEELAMLMNDVLPDVATVKAKIRSLRNAYILEVHKMISSSKRGAPAESLYVPTVPWFNTAHRFLHSAVELKDTKDNTRTTDSPNIVCLTENDIEYITDNPEVSSKPKPQAKRQDLKRAVNVIQDLNPKISPSKRLKISRGKISVPSAAVDISKHEISPQRVVSSGDHPVQPKEDEFDIFARSVANHLRSMPIRLSLECQGVITNYLIQQRLKAYKSAKGKRTSADKSGIQFSRTSLPNIADSGNEDENYETAVAITTRGDSENEDEYETAVAILDDDSDAESKPVSLV